MRHSFIISLVHIVVVLFVVSSCSELNGTDSEHLRQADSISCSLGLSAPDIYSHMEKYYKLYKLEKNQENYSAAMAAIDSFILISDSLRNMAHSVEIEKVKDKYKSELEQQRLSLNSKIKILYLISLFLLIVLVFLLKDRLNKNKVHKLQKQLNTLNVNLLQESSSDEEDIEESGSTEVENRHFDEYFKNKLDLCLQFYKETDLYRRISIIEDDELRHKIHLNAAERQKVCEELYEHFSDLMADLKSQCTSLTKQDILYCIFFMINCSKYTILLCTSISDGAFKTRKSRIKEKLGEDLFKLLCT